MLLGKGEETGKGGGQAAPPFILRNRLFNAGNVLD